PLLRGTIPRLASLPVRAAPRGPHHPPPGRRVARQYRLDRGRRRRRPPHGTRHHPGHHRRHSLRCPPRRTRRPRPRVRPRHGLRSPGRVPQRAPAAQVVVRSHVLRLDRETSRGPVPRELRQLRADCSRRGARRGPGRMNNLPHRATSSPHPAVHIAILGPTASGKGTLIRALAARHPFHPITLGEILRDKVSSGTALGLLTRDYIRNGELVPDEFVDAMVEEVFRHLPRRTNTLLDGFPRTLAQARFLDDLLAELGQKLDLAVYLHLSDEQIAERAARRQPPRHDDEPHILRHRLHVFRRTIAPALRHYLDDQRLAVLRADAPVEQLVASVDD